MKEQILAIVSKPGYSPIKPRALARRLGMTDSQSADFRRAIDDLVRQGRIEFGRNHVIRPVGGRDSITGTFRRNSAGRAFVRLPLVDGQPPPEIVVRSGGEMDAATGDQVRVRILKKAGRPGGGPTGEIVQVLERATRQFVGHYHERDGKGLVRVDGGIFRHSVDVGDAGARGVKAGDTVVIEMLHFPTIDDRGEAVIAEVLGARGAPGVDLLAIIRTYQLPDVFPEDVLEEARDAAVDFDEHDLEGREDLTNTLIVTIDPVDARDFDDAISLTQDPKTKHWQLGVHIADVGRFAPHGGALDREARNRGTSVYLPGRVIPMFPELISNGLASLQEGRVRFCKSAFMGFTPAGQRTDTRFADTAIKVTKRFAYEQVSEILLAPPGKKTKQKVPEDVLQLLFQMRDLAMIMRKRRAKRGALELSLPEVVLEYDDQGRVSGAHAAVNDVSHQVIEEFMLAANEAVASFLNDQEVRFLRRVHPAPDVLKLKAFSAFARSLGYKIDTTPDRFTLQKVLEQASKRPDVQAVSYALLRSMKQAVYSPFEEEHYALASQHYCHFTSPIRRYPDLTVHRLLGQWIKHKKIGSDEVEQQIVAEHCTRMEKRAEAAERELVKIKLLTFLSEQIGWTSEAVITGVADYGFFAQGVSMPVEGMVHISTLADDYYHYDDETRTLTGRRTGRRYRLGDRVTVEVVRVDVNRRQLDFRVVSESKPAPAKRTSRPRRRE